MPTTAATAPAVTGGD